MGVFDKKPRVLRVRTEWLHLAPRKPHAFWAEVSRRVRDQRIRHKDLARIKEVCVEVESEQERKRKERDHDKA